MNWEGMVTTWTHGAMLAATAPAAGAAAKGGLPLNAFDFLLIVTLIVGFIIGRKRGMSLELLDVFEWLLIVVVAPLYYQGLGNLLSLQTGLPLVYTYMICFAAIGIAIKTVFTTFKVKAGEKVIGSDLFGSWEYYLGMGAGMLRFFCMLLVALALLHAIPYNEAEVKKEIERRKKANDGSENIPPFGSIQLGIFKNSFAGPLIAKHLADQLIVATNPNLKAGQAGAPPSLQERKEKRKAEATNAPAAPKQ